MGTARVSVKSSLTTLPVTSYYPLPFNNFHRFAGSPLLSSRRSSPSVVRDRRRYGFLAGQQALQCWGGTELPAAVNAMRRSPSGMTATGDIEIDFIIPDEVNDLYGSPSRRSSESRHSKRQSEGSYLRPIVPPWEAVQIIGGRV